MKKKVKLSEREKNNKKSNMPKHTCDKKGDKFSDCQKGPKIPEYAQKLTYEEKSSKISKWPLEMKTAINQTGPSLESKRW